MQSATQNRGLSHNLLCTHTHNYAVVSSSIIFKGSCKESASEKRKTLH